MVNFLGTTGVHFVNSIINMLLTGTTTYKGTPVTPEHNDLDEIEAMTSPRILGFHAHYEMLPKQIKEKKAKIIYIVRNPKDVLTSWWRYNTNLTNGIYIGNFRGMFKRFLEDECKYINLLNN